MTESQNHPVFELEKVYLKDVSFESPECPNIFLKQGFQPEINVELLVDHTVLNPDEGYYEVVLSAEVKAVFENRTVFLVAVQQAGIFKVKNFDETQLPAMIEVASPTQLLPFMRETVSELVSKGGFPQLLLSPVNFEILYARKLEKMREREEAAGAEQTTH